LRFDDVVLYRIVRALDESSQQRELWVRAAIPYALLQRDHSLIETLLLVLGRGCVRFPELVAAAEDVARDSRQMTRVLRNVGASPVL
jgi:hypothetical protein